jgi:hypothetical protein
VDVYMLSPQRRQVKVTVVTMEEVVDQDGSVHRIKILVISWDPWDWVVKIWKNS